MLIGTDFLQQYGTEINHKSATFSILGYSVPLLFQDDPSAFLVSRDLTNRHHIRVSFPHGVLGVPYQVQNHHVTRIEETACNSCGIQIRADHESWIPALSQAVIDTGLTIDVPQGMLLDISRINGISPREPIAAPSTWDLGDTSPLWILHLTPQIGQWKYKSTNTLPPFVL